MSSREKSMSVKEEVEFDDLWDKLGKIKIKNENFKSKQLTPFSILTEYFILQEWKKAKWPQKFLVDVWVDEKSRSMV